MNDNRWEHQPVLEPVVHEQLGAAEQRAACGKTIALVVADDWNTTPLTVTYDDPEQEPYVCDGRDGDESAPELKLPRPLQHYEGKPLIAHAVELAHAGGFAAAEVMLCGAAEHEDAVRAAIGDSLPVRSVDAAGLATARAELNEFELFNVNAAVILAAKELLAEHPDADSVMVIGCTSPRLTPWHLAQLCLRQQENPSCDVVFSWFVWLRRLPTLIARTFFDTAREQGLFAAREGSTYRPLPQLAAEDLVFGEEKLAGNDSSSERRDAFLADDPISALEAVTLVRKLTKLSDGEARKETRGLSRASLELLDVAREVVGKMDAALDDAEHDELAAQSAWGERNKGDFAIFGDLSRRNSLVYLDSAATSQRLLSAVQAEADFNNHANANIYRGCYELSARSTAAFNDARAVVEEHIGAAPHQLAFTANTTDSVNKAAQAWALRNLQEGDLVLITISEHHSNMMPWCMAAKARSARIAYIPLLGDGHIDMDAYRALLEQRPRLVCVAQISNTLGIENPVKKMAALAHEVGARFFCDAAQSFPHLAIDVRELGCDFLAFSGHKAYGPFGIGGLWISDEAFAEMDPSFGGGGIVSHVGRESYYLRVGAVQYEAGTPPIAQAMGLARAIEQLDTLGMDAVAAHSRALTKYLLAGLDTLANMTVWGDHSGEDGLTGLVSFSLTGVACARLASDLGALGVCIRAGGQCALPFHAAMGLEGSARVSFGIHNTAADVEALITAVAMSAKLAGHEAPFHD